MNSIDKETADSRAGAKQARQFLPSLISGAVLDAGLLPVRLGSGVDHPNVILRRADLCWATVTADRLILVFGLNANPAGSPTVSTSPNNGSGIPARLGRCAARLAWCCSGVRLQSMSGNKHTDVRGRSPGRSPAGVPR